MYKLLTKIVATHNTFKMDILDMDILICKRNDGSQL